MNNLLVAQDARDRYNEALLRATYARKRDEILASGDDVRIRLMNAFLKRDNERRAA